MIQKILFKLGLIILSSELHMYQISAQSEIRKWFKNQLQDTPAVAVLSKHTS